MMSQAAGNLDFDSASAGCEMRSVVLLLVATACAHARSPTIPRVALETASLATARVGAARLELWITNEGPDPARVVLDPDALQVEVMDPAGHAVPCDRSAATRSTDGSLLAPGERASVQLDLTRRCGLHAPGAYRVQVGHPASGSKCRVELRLTRWANPGPRSPAQRPRDDDLETEPRE
ncbi:MAG: hypothetical protein A2V77_08680 [Anaeromyxobacter sp. RBG_16_69_14]|nr:MAG: hypothetical protein A2V77_08680 [Anaeromyxobacter sp. RBG_16_69_14]